MAGAIKHMIHRKVIFPNLSTCCSLFTTSCGFGEKKIKSDEEIPVIRYPLALKRQQIKRRRPKDTAKGGIKLAKPGKLFVSGDDKFKTMYTNEFVGKFTPPDLISSTWKSRNSPGRHLTIHATRQNPAFKEEVSTFEGLGLNADVCKALSARNISTPTAVQKKVIPLVLDGNNVVFAAETGSGKTLAYLLPVIQKLLTKKLTVKESNIEESISPSAVMLTPTKELNEQVVNMANALQLPLQFNLLKMKSINKPSKGIAASDVIVTSPLTLLLAIKQRKLNLGHLQFAVLDECDTLFDESFIASTKQILQRFNIISGKQQPVVGSARAQLLLCSATFPKYAVTALEEFLAMENMTIARTGYLHRVSPHVTHKFIRIKPSEKMGTLLKILNQTTDQQCMVFCNSRRMVGEVSRSCLENGIPILAVVGGDDYEARSTSIKDFQSGKHQILITTDLSSRGLDTKQVGHVINFEIPNQVSDYIHRCGRVGRVGQEHEGLVTNLVSRKWEIETVQKIEVFSAVGSFGGNKIRTYFSQEAARRREEISSVNANIKKQHTDRWSRQSQNEMELI